MSTFYEDEQFKLIIDFSDVTGLSDYEAMTGAPAKELPPFDPEHPDEPWTHSDDSTEKYIQTIHKKSASGNSGSNPIGHMASATLYISVFDDEDTINPMNESSAYAGHMTPGRKVQLLKSTDGTNWSSYFKGFITNWQGSFKDGYYGITTITATDLLNNIGVMDLSAVSYTGENAKQALEAIFTAYGLTSSDYVIDNSLNLQSIAYASLKSPARQTINDICYKAIARVVMKQDGKIYVEPLIITAPVTADHVLTANDIGPLTPVNTNAVSFSKVKVSYLSGDGLAYQKIASQTDIKLINGVTEIVLDSLEKIYSVDDVDITINEESAPQEYNSITYRASDNSVTVSVNATLDGEKSARIDVYGLVAGGTQTKSVSVDISGSAIGAQASTFEYNSSSIMTTVTATALANKLADYIRSLRKQIEIQQTTLSSDVEVGDTVQIIGVSTTYNGMYIVSAVSLENTEDYNVSITLLKLD
jgi:hypothetical protein